MHGNVHFERAPLEEVVCGVHFTGVNWSDIHFGLFFNQVKEYYPHTQRRQPLTFTLPAQTAPHITVLSEPELPRLWYESPTSPFLLQIQKDAFLVNWRRQSGTFTYPHFRTRAGQERGVWDQFVHEWNVFCTFCEQANIGMPEILFCHLAYINHLVQGETWKDPGDLARWFRPLVGLRHVSPVSAFSLTVSHTSHDVPIRISVRPAVRTSDSKKLFIVDFVSTEKLPPGTEIEAWFDKAHDTIIAAFVAQTTEDAHQEWRLSHG